MNSRITNDSETANDYICFEYASQTIMMLQFEADIAGTNMQYQEIKFEEPRNKRALVEEALPEISVKKKANVIILHKPVQIRVAYASLPETVETVLAKGKRRVLFDDGVTKIIEINKIELEKYEDMGEQFNTPRYCEDFN
uniref:UPF0319 protein n=1 Tax=Rhabditophanes sp. KR3021 TaxID=114890 RepID=A0AC35U6Y4_9BILA